MTHPTPTHNHHNPSQSYLIPIPTIDPTHSTSILTHPTLTPPNLNPIHPCTISPHTHPTSLQPNHTLTNPNPTPNQHHPPVIRPNPTPSHLITHSTQPSPLIPHHGTTRSQRGTTHNVSDNAEWNATTRGRAQSTPTDHVQQHRSRQSHDQHTTDAEQNTTQETTAHNTKDSAGRTTATVYTTSTIIRGPQEPDVASPIH